MTLTTHAVPNFPCLRDDQPETVAKIMEAFNNNKRVVILQAPTGTGKSIIGRTVCTAFHSSYILMPSRGLQDQYWGDFSQSGDIALLKGKANYNCVIEESAPSVDEAACQFQRSGKQIKECLEEGCCPYYAARNRAIEARDTIMNFAAYLTWRMVSEDSELGYFNQRQLHVIDEAHRVEDVVCDFLGIKLFEGQLKKMMKRQGTIPDMPREGNEEAVAAYLREIHDAATAALEGLCVDYDAHNIDALLSRAMEIRSIEREVMPIFTLKEKIKRLFENDIESYAMGFSYEQPRGKMNPGGPLVQAKPLFIGSYVKQRVLGEYTLFMSATLPMTETWARDMGLQPEEYEVINVPSHFPHENRPVFFTTIGKLSKGEAEKKVPEAAAMIRRILEKFPQVKGIIHTPSYAYSKLLQEQFLLDNRFLFCLSGEDTQILLEKHIRTEGQTIIVSPALREGVDLKDELARFQIIVKAPYDSLGDPAIYKKMKRNPRWYDSRCLTHFLQMLGRPIRHKDDFARTYVLDEDLWHFLHRVRKDIPDYVLDAFHQF